jgi:hypothetical protein
MSEQEKHSHNVLAHILGILGFVISLASISWQVYLHYEAQTEKLSINLMLVHPVEPGEEEDTVENKKGWLLFDVANVGNQPLYLKDLLMSSCTLEAEQSGQSGCQDWYIYPTSFPETDSERLEPGAAKSFWKKDWDFEKNPIRDCCKHLSAPQFYIRATSTRGAIDHATVQVQNAFAHMDEKQKKNSRSTKSVP